MNKRGIVALRAIALCLALLFIFKSGIQAQHPPRRLEILFLSDTIEHHDGAALAGILSREYTRQGINITYASDPDDLLRNDLEQYDGLILYANYSSITSPQENALLHFVRSGKGFIPLHCASYCFRNSDEVVEMIGGQFKSHGQGSFPAVIIRPDHPVMKDVPAFSTIDETYNHDKISKNIEVLTERVDSTHHEPYTWVRQYGSGRVFYTAYGHDTITWNNPGFLKLVYNGILWAVGDEAKARVGALKFPQPAYTVADIPNYEKRDPPPKLQAPLSSDESMLLTQLPVNFELKLFASEPDISKPVYMNWDERGRLWIVETVNYPNTVLDNKSAGKDRIKILEDTDGDGRADKFTVFADKLNIPTSFAFINGGIVVAEAPYFLFLKDTNGDDRADIRDTIMTGWGAWDTHSGPSNFRYGPDNTIWATVGYSGFKGKIGKDKDSTKFTQGVFHFTGDGKKLEYLGASSNNTWGLGFTEDYDVFISTANNTHSAALTIPKRYYDMDTMKSTPSVHKIESHYAMHTLTKNLRQVDVHGGFTAAAGHSFYTARAFPKEYWNRVSFVCEPTGRVIHKNIIERDGASFKEGQDGWNFVASSDEWFGPIQAETGPDGNLWMIDWYNFIIQHNPTPAGFENGKGNAYINPLRDSVRGRIYMIHYKGSENDQKFRLDKNDPDKLVQALSNTNMFWRTTAQRLLVESGNKKIQDKLFRLIADTSMDEIGLNPAAIHALWTLQGLKAFTGTNDPAIKAAVNALKHPAGGVRRAAIQVLPNSAAVANALIRSGVFHDSDLRVVLAAVLKSCDLPMSAILRKTLADVHSDDQWINQALVIAAKMQDPVKRNSLKALAVKETVARPDKVITIRTVQNQMKYDQKKITAKAGSMLEIVFQNDDFMQHNLVVLQQGSMKSVGAAADRLAAAPDGADRQYIPAVAEVLFHTPLLNPGKKFSLKFRVPDKTGEYPFICTFPGHWRIMNGILTVN
jgi:putative membrane-bound dehydrogenase-like protein